MRTWISTHQLASFLILMLAVVLIGTGYLMYARPNNVTQAAVPAEKPEATVDLDPLEAKLDAQTEAMTEAVDALTEAVEAQGEDISESIDSLVSALAAEPAAPTPPTLEAEPTPCPEEPTDTTEPVAVVEEEVAGPTWSDPDAFDSRETEYPMGDANSWTYMQTWDGKDTSTVLHVGVAPGVVVVVREYVGTRFQVWNGPDIARWEEMRHECQVRDQLPKTPALIIIESTTDADIKHLPSNWSVLSFPR